MRYEEIETILRKKIGFDAHSVGSSSIAAAVKERMTACNIRDLPNYIIRVQTSSRELEALIEEVIVPETWFFRNPEAFNFLCHYVLFEWLPQHPNGILRVLSAPCSTGEEPYSIAMSLIDAGVAPKQFYIDAVDISKHALLKAGRALYRQHSFRGKNLAYRERYFQKTPEGYRLSDLVSSRVNLIRGNLIDPFFLSNRTSYDIIFCRNLLIYFDEAARQRTVQVLDRLLSPTGLLFVGAAETGSILEDRFVSLRHPMTFAYQKPQKLGESKPAIAPTQKSAKLGKQEKAPEYSPTIQPPISMPTSKLENSQPRVSNSSSSVGKVNEPPIRENTQESLLEKARSLADKGQLEEAAALCETYLSEHRTNVGAYVLLGEVFQAGGNEDRAEQCFQKAIYLDPYHYEALVHLTLLKEHRGDRQGAELIRQRIQRLLKS